MVIRYEADQNILVVTKGHPFDRGAFHAMLDDVLMPNGLFARNGLSWTHVEQPAATALLGSDAIIDYDAILFYDMAGIAFRNPDPPLFIEPPSRFESDLAALTRRGIPLFFLHHALAAWPAWPGYGDMIGGHFRYAPAPEHNAPADGYRHDVEHHISVVTDHPVTDGLGAGFTITDELYLVSIDETDKLPLLRSDHHFVDTEFYSAELALRGQLYSNEGWTHPKGSNLIAWLKRADNSPILYFQCGDGPSAYANAGFRTVIGNGLRWLLSDDAKDWVANWPNPAKTP